MTKQRKLLLTQFNRNTAHYRIGSVVVVVRETETISGDYEDDKLCEERARQYLSCALLNAIEVHVGWENDHECMRRVMKATEDMR